jgi:hypothetical protein
MSDPQLERLKTPSVRQKLVQVLAFAREGRHAEHTQFANTVSKLLGELKLESPEYPLRRFLDCLREADRRLDASANDFPTESFLKPLVGQFGLAGYVICAYISGLPGFSPLGGNHRQPLESHDLTLFNIGITRLQRLMDIPDMQSAFVYDNPDWKVATLLACEDLLHRLCFSESTTNSRHRKMSHNDQQELVKRTYKACSDFRGILANTSAKGVFERFLRDSIPYLKSHNQHWLAQVRNFSYLYRIIGSNDSAEFANIVRAQLSSKSKTAIQFAAQILGAAVVPIDLWTSKRLCQLIDGDSGCSKDAANAFKTGNFTCDETKNLAVLIIETRLNDLCTRVRLTPKDQITRDRYTDILKSLTRPIEIDEDDRWGGDYTSAP